MTLWIWLHIACMTIGFALLIVATLVPWFAGPVPLHPHLSRWEGIGRLLVLGGIATGLVVASPWGYGRGWLVASYVLTGLTMVLGAALGRPGVRVRWPGVPVALSLANIVLWTAILWLMVAKP